VILPADAEGPYNVFVQTGGPFEFIYTNNQRDAIGWDN